MALSSDDISSRLAIMRQIAGQSTPKTVAQPTDLMQVDTHEKQNQPNRAGYRKATGAEKLLGDIYKAGEGISDIFGFGEGVARSRERIAKENPNASEAELFLRSTGENLPAFLGNLPGMMVGAIPLGFSKLAGEFIGGSAISEIDDGWIPEAPLDWGQRAASALDAAIDIGGLFLGGSGSAFRAGKTLLKGGKVAASTAERAAKQIVEQAAKGSADDIARAAARADEILKTQKLTAKEAVSTAKRFSTGNVAGDIALESLEEGGEEFFQSLMEDLRGDQSGHAEWFSGDHNWTKATEEAILGALGGAVMSGVSKGVSSLIDYDARKNKKSNTTTQEQVNALRTKYKLSEDGTDIFMPGAEEAMSEQLETLNRYSSGFIAVGISNHRIPMNSYSCGLVDIVHEIVKERALPEGERYFTQWLTSGGEVEYQSDNGQTQRLDLARLPEFFSYEAQSPKEFDSLIANINAMLQTRRDNNDVYEAVMFKNPGGPYGVLGLNLFEVDGLDSHVVVHQLSAGAAGADFDSDRYTIIDKKAFVGQNGDSIRIETPIEAFNGRGTDGWRDGAWKSFGFTAASNDAIKRWMLQKYSEQGSQFEKRSELSKEDFEKVMQYLLDAENSTYATGTDLELKDIKNNARESNKRISILCDSYGWSFLSFLAQLDSQTESGQLSKLFFEECAPNASASSMAKHVQKTLIEQSKNAVQLQKAVGISDAMPDTGFESDRLTYINASANVATAAGQRWLTMQRAINSLYEAATKGQNYSFCREWLQLYFDVKGKIGQITANQEFDQTYRSVLQSLVLDRLNMLGPGMHPEAQSINDIRWLIATESLVEYQAIVSNAEAKGSRSNIEILQDCFMDSYRANRAQFVELAQEIDPNIKKEKLDLMFPPVDKFNVYNEMLKAFDNIPAFMISQSIGTDETMGSIVSGKLQKIALGEYGEVDYIDKVKAAANEFVTTNVEEKAENEKAAVEEFIKNLIDAGVKVKMQDNAALVRAIHELVTAVKNNSKALDALREYRRRGRAKQAGEEPSEAILEFFSNELSGTDVATVLDYFAFITAALGGAKTLTSLNRDWATLGGFLTTNQSDEFEFAADFVDLLLSDNAADVENALVSIKIVYNLKPLLERIAKFMAAEDSTEKTRQLNAMRAEATKISMISPFYQRLISNVFGDSITSSNFNPTNEQCATYADMLTRFASPRKSIVEKYQAASDSIGYVPDPYNGDVTSSMNMFISDAMASITDATNITSLSSNLRNAKYHINDLFTFSSRSLATAKEALHSVLSQDKSQDGATYMQYVRYEQEELATRTDDSILGQILYGYKFRPTKDTISKTQSIQSAEAMHRRFSIMTRGYITDDVDSDAYATGGTEDFGNFIRNPQTVARLIHTDFIQDRGGLSLRTSDNKRVTFKNRGEFISFLAYGDKTSFSNDKVLTWTVIDKILEKYPTLVYAFVPSSLSLDFSATSGTISETSSVDTDFSGTFNALAQKYGKAAGAESVYQTNKMRNNIANAIFLGTGTKDSRGEEITGEKVMSLFWYMLAESTDADVSSPAAAMRTAKKHVDSFVDMVINYAAADEDGRRRIINEVTSSSNEKAGQILQSACEALAARQSATILYDFADDASLDSLLYVMQTSLEVWKTAYASDKSESNNQSVISSILNKILGPRQKCHIDESIWLLSAKNFLATRNDDIAREVNETLTEQIGLIIEADNTIVDKQAAKEAMGQVSAIISGSSAADKRFDFFKKANAKTISELLESLTSQQLGRETAEAVEGTSWFEGNESYFNAFTNMVKLISSLINPGENPSSKEFQDVVSFLESRYTDTGKGSAFAANLPLVELEKVVTPGQSDVEQLIDVFVSLTTNAVSSVDFDMSAVSAHKRTLVSFLDAWAGKLNSAYGNLPQTGSIDLRFPAPTLLNADFAARITDETLRGGIPMQTSTAANERLDLASPLSDINNDIDSIKTQAELLQHKTKWGELRRRATEWAKLFLGETATLDDLELEFEYSGTSVGKIYRFPDGNITVTPLTLRDLILSDRHQDDEDVYATTIFDDNTGFSSRYWGENGEAEDYCPLKIIPSKYVLRGAEDKALQAAKKPGMHPFPTFDKVAVNDILISDDDRTVKDENGVYSVGNILKAVKDVKGAFARTLRNKYLSDDADMEDKAIDFSHSDIMEMANYSHQYVNVYFKNPVHVDGVKGAITHIPVPVKLLYAAAADANILELGYKARIDDAGHVIELSSETIGNNIDRVEVVTTDLPQIARTILDYEADKELDIKAKKEIGADWSSSAAEAVNKIGNGELLYKFEHLSNESAADAIGRDLSLCRFNLSGIHQSRLGIEGHPTMAQRADVGARGAVQNSEEDLRNQSILANHRSASRTGLLYVASFVSGNEARPAEFNSVVEEAAEKVSLFNPETDVAYIGSAEADINNYISYRVRKRQSIGRNGSPRLVDVPLARRQDFANACKRAGMTVRVSGKYNQSRNNDRIILVVDDNNVAAINYDTSEFVTEDVGRYETNVFTRVGVPADGMKYLTNPNASYLAQQQKGRSEIIQAPDYPGTTITVASKADILANIKSISDSIRSITKDSDEEVALNAYINAVGKKNSPVKINSEGLIEGSFSSALETNVVGFWKIEAKDAKNKTIVRYAPIIVKMAGPNAAWEATSKRNQNQVEVRYTITFDPETNVSFKGHGETSAVKGQYSRLDTAASGRFYLQSARTNRGDFGFTVQNIDYSAKKAFQWPVRIWSYWRWMRQEGLSMFLRVNQREENGKTTDEISFDNSIFGNWMPDDIADFFSNDVSRLNKVWAKLVSGELSFTDRNGQADSAFNSDMIDLFDKFLSYRNPGHTMSSVLSGYDIRVENNNGQLDVKIYNQAPPRINMYLLCKDLEETTLQRIFNQTSKEHYCGVGENATTQTFDNKGYMRVGRQLPNGDMIVYDYMPCAIEYHIAADGTDTSESSLTDSVTAGNKIKALAALAGNLPQRERAALRAEALLHRGNTNVTRMFYSEDGTETVLGKSGKAPGIMRPRQQAEPRIENDLLMTDAVIKPAVKPKELFYQRQLSETRDRVLSQSGSNPGIRLSRTGEIVNSDKLRTYFSNEIDAIQKCFRNVGQIDDSLIWEWIKGQLGYNFSDTLPWLPEEWIRQAIGEIARDLSGTSKIPVSYGQTHFGNTVRYKVPPLSEKSIDFLLENPPIGLEGTRNKTALVTLIAANTNAALGIISAEPNAAKRQALISTVAALSSRNEDLNDLVQTGIFLGMDTIEDVENYVTSFQDWLVEDEFMDSAKAMTAYADRVVRDWQKRIDAYSKRHKKRAAKDDLYKIEGGRVVYNIKKTDPLYIKACNYLTSASKMMAMAQPLLLPMSVAERFGYGGMTRIFLSGSIKGYGNMYTSNLYQYVPKAEDRVRIDNLLRSLAETDEMTELIENRRLLSLLAVDGITKAEIDAAGGPKAFLMAHRADDNRFRKVYDTFMSWQTGKGFGSSLQANIYLLDLVRLISNTPEVADFLLGQTSPDGTMTQLEYILNGANAADWLYKNAFEPGSLLSELSEQAFNTSMEGDAAKQTLFTIWFSEFAKAHPVINLFGTTTLCRFPMYALNITDRVMNTIFPVTSLNYVLTRFASSEKMATKKIPFLKGVEFGMIDWNSTLTVNSLQEALALDLQRWGTMLVATFLLGISGAVEPPPDEDKWGNIDEWLFFGQRIAPRWWVKDLLGPTLSFVATWKAAALGKPRFDILFRGCFNAAISNPVIKAADIVDNIMDPYGAYMEDYYAEVDRFSKAADGAPDGVEFIWADASTRLLNWATQFILPSIAKEIYQALPEHEKSYKKVYKTNAFGEVIKDSNGNPILVDATYQEQKIRLLTRKNPILGFLLDIGLGAGFAGDKAGYLLSEMPDTIYYDSTQLDTYRRLSIFTTDDNGNIVEKSESEKQAIALEVITMLQSYDNLDELVATGFAVPYDTLDYVGDIIWDIAQSTEESYALLKITGQLDPYTLGDGDPDFGNEIIGEMAGNASSLYQYWKDFYYNKLWSDQMKAGLQRYNRYNTTYAKDDNGNVYATGFRRGNILSIAGLFEVAPKHGTLGYEGDWATPSAVTGKSLEQRALIPIDERVQTPSWDSRGSNGDGTGYSKSYPKYMSSYYGPGYRGYSSGSSSSYIPAPPRMYAPSGTTSRLQGPDTTYRSNRPISTVDLNTYFIRPGFETKGSRKAYKREDI